MVTTQDGASSDQTSTEEIAEAQRVRRTHEIEEHLQAGCVSEAIKMGWCGSLASYELVKTGEGTTAVKVRLSGSTLGFGLSNDRGIAVVIDADNSSTLRSGDVVRSVNSVRLFTCEAVVGAIRNATTTYGVVSLRLGRPNPLQSSPVKAGPPAPAVTLEDLRRQEQLEAQLEAHREAQKEAHLGTLMLHVPNAATQRALMLHVPNAATQRASSSARSARLHLDDLVGLSLSEPPTPSPPTPPSPRGPLAAAARDMPSVLGRSPSPVYEAKLGAAVAQAPARATRMARRSIAARDEEGGGKVVDGKVVVDGASRDGASFSGTRGDSASLGHSASFAAVSDIPESVALATAALDEAVEATLEGDGDLVDLICAIATHAEAAAGSEPLRRALRRRDELVAGPSAQETPAKAPAPPTQTVLSLTVDNLALLDCASKGYMDATTIMSSVRVTSAGVTKPRRTPFVFTGAFGLRRRVSLPELGLKTLHVAAASGDTTPTTASASWTSPNASPEHLAERLTAAELAASERGTGKKLTRRLSLPLSSRKM